MNPAARLAERKKAVEAVKDQKKEKAAKKAAEKVIYLSSKQTFILRYSLRLLNKRTNQNKRSPSKHLKDLLQKLQLHRDNCFSR
jgi:hypothetical protein